MNQEIKKEIKGRGLTVKVTAVNKETGEKLYEKEVTSSWLLGFFSMLYVMISGSNSNVATTDTGGQTFALEPAANTFRLNNFQVGTGNTANIPDQGHMQTPIGNGVGAGQLVYGAISIAYAVVGNTINFTITRPFTNSSGAQIVATEIGLTSGGTLFNGDAAHFWVIERTLVNIPFPAGNTVTVTYTISSTVA